MITHLARRPSRTVRSVLGALLTASLALLVAGVPSAMAQAASSSPIASDDLTVPHDVPDLEALFPDSVDGHPLFSVSIGRPTLEAMGGASMGEFDALADALGVERTAFELAFANDPTVTPVFNYLAFRAAGVPGSTLVETYEGMTAQTQVGAVAHRVTIDGREVVWLEIPYNPIPNLWFWAEGDTLVGIQAADTPTFEKLYRLMPTRAPAPSVSPAA